MKVTRCDICGERAEEYVDPSGRIWRGLSVDIGPLRDENFALCGKCRKAVIEYSGFEKTSQTEEE